MNARYEVQFKDGLGAWRRWSLCKTWDAAHESRLRLRGHLGTELVSVRIVERVKRAA